MEKREFNKLANDMLKSAKDVLTNKGDSYMGASQDRLIAFKEAALISKCTPVSALHGMVVKHDVSVLEAIRRMEADTNYTPSVEWVEEKLGDRINYNILLAALIEDRRRGE